MKLLVTIPHFFGRTRSDTRAKYGSQIANAEARRNALSSCVGALHQQFGRHQAMIQVGQRRTVDANTAKRCEVHVVVCTASKQHLLDQISIEPSLFHHSPSDVDPMTLGLSCHEVLRDRCGNYDYYCFLEDDLILHDPWFFAKLAWFTQRVGNDKLLQPNRFERGTGTRHHKVYLDGDLKPRTTAPFQDVNEESSLNSTVMGVPIRFQRPLNPHSGCFFLNADQMQHWAKQSYFNKPDTSFIGPLESAATLGVMKTFKIYKPTRENASFLEIEHSGDQFLRKIRVKKAG
jgi:hypothetical protein